MAHSTRLKNLLVSVAVAEQFGDVDVYTIPEDGRTVVVLSNTTKPVILSADDYTAMSARGIHFDPEYSDEWSADCYMAFVSYEGDNEY